MRASSFSRCLKQSRCAPRLWNGSEGFWESNFFIPSREIQCNRWTRLWFRCLLYPSIIDHQWSYWLCIGLNECLQLVWPNASMIVTQFVQVFSFVLPNLTVDCWIYVKIWQLLVVTFLGAVFSWIMQNKSSFWPSRTLGNRQRFSDQTVAECPLDSLSFHPFSIAFCICVESKFWTGIFFFSRSSNAKQLEWRANSAQHESTHVGAARREEFAVIIRFLLIHHRPSPRIFRWPWHSFRIGTTQLIPASFHCALGTGQSCGSGLDLQFLILPPSLPPSNMTKRWVAKLTRNSGTTEVHWSSNAVGYKLVVSSSKREGCSGSSR